MRTRKRSRIKIWLVAGLVLLAEKADAAPHGFCPSGHSMLEDLYDRGVEAVWRAARNDPKTSKTTPAIATSQDSRHDAFKAQLNSGSNYDYVGRSDYLTTRDGGQIIATSPSDGIFMEDTRVLQRIRGAEAQRAVDSKPLVSHSTNRPSKPPTRALADPLVELTLDLEKSRTKSKYAASRYKSVHKYAQNILPMLLDAQSPLPVRREDFAISISTGPLKYREGVSARLVTTKRGRSGVLVTTTDGSGVTVEYLLGERDWVDRFTSVLKVGAGESGDIKVREFLSKVREESILPHLAAAQTKADADSIRLEKALTKVLDIRRNIARPGYFPAPRAHSAVWHDMQSLMLLL
jgi:hypothetical protein